MSVRSRPDGSLLRNRPDGSRFWAIVGITSLKFICKKVWKWGESTLTCRNEIVPFIGDIWELAFAIPAFGVISHLTLTSLKEPRCRCTSRDNVAPSWTTLIPSDIAFVNLQFKEVTFNSICLNIWEKETWKVTTIWGWRTAMRWPVQCFNSWATRS